MKASLVNDLWEELRIEWMDMELQHLFFEFLKELRPGIIFQWNYSPRALILIKNGTLYRITDHWWLDPQTVKKLIAFRSRRFIACHLKPGVLNNAGVMWCAKESRMRVLVLRRVGRFFIWSRFVCLREVFWVQYCNLTFLLFLPSSVMILLAFLSCFLGFFFVKDQIASFQLKQIIVFLN